MTPGELRQAVNELRDNWNALRNQLIGRAVTPRRDVPAAVITEAQQGYDAFRRFYAKISKGFLREMFGMYQGELQAHLRNYQRIHRMAAKALKRLPKKETLKAPPMGEWVETPSLSPWLIAGVFGGIAYIFWQMRRRNK